MTILIALIVIAIVVAGAVTLLEVEKSYSVIVGTCATVAVVAFVAVIGVYSYREITRERRDSRATVATYLEALRAGRFRAAYGQLCEDARKSESLRAFVARQKAGPQLRDYEIAGKPRSETRLKQGNSVGLSASPTVVEAKLRFADGVYRVSYAYTGRRSGGCLSGYLPARRG